MNTQIITLVLYIYSLCSDGRRDFESIEDMTNFVENLSEYSHQQGVTWKHVTLMSELSHAVDRRGLMRVSGVEQVRGFIYFTYNIKAISRPIN